MAQEKGKKIPHRAYVGSAQSHLASAKVLISSGQHDHASFHLITALEELSRAHVEQVEDSGAFKGLKWRGKPVLGNVSGARKNHEFKVPSGLMVVVTRVLELYDAEIQIVSPSCPPETRTAMVEKLASEIEWLAGQFGTVDGIRELSIYAGWDNPNVPRPTVDWKRLAGVLCPVLDRELDFQKFLLAHPLGQKEFDELRAQFVAFSEKKTDGAH